MSDHDQQPPRQLPLHALHARLGAELAPFGGTLAPASYGDTGAEHRALSAACGLIDRSWAGRLEMVGADRARFLHGLVTCDVKGLLAGQGAYGFITQAKGRVLADLTVLALEDRLWLELPPGPTAPISAHLGRYKIADRVELLPLEDRLPLTLIGPRAGELLDLDALDADPWSHAPATVRGHRVELLREARFGVPAFTLWTAAADAEPLVEALLADGAAAAGWRALEILRVERGRPRHGIDFGDDCFPQETGLEAEAVRYDKGCYLGQEVVARIHYRGGVNRHLRGLVFDRVEQPAGKALTLDGRAVGTVTSAVASPSAGRWIGLAVVHQRAEPGAVLEVEDGGRAELIALPFSFGSE